MFKKGIIFLLAMMLTASLVFARDTGLRKLTYKIEELASKEKAAYQLNKFYPIHYFYINIFLAFNIVDNFSYEQRKDIIQQVIKIISRNNTARIIINNFMNNEDLVLAFKPDHPPKYPDKTILWFFSNYDFSKKKIVSGDNMKNSYASLYYLEGDKLIKYQYMYSKQKEAELIKADNINNLADYYIYDNKPDNDAKAEKMLTGRIKETKDINKKFICMLTLSEYYCIRNDLEKVKKLLAELRGMLPQLDDRLKGNYEMIFNAANDMYTMMQEL